MTSIGQGRGTVPLERAVPLLLGERSGEILRDIFHSVETGAVQTTLCHNLADIDFLWRYHDRDVYVSDVYQLPYTSGTTLPSSKVDRLRAATVTLDVLRQLERHLGVLQSTYDQTAAHGMEPSEAILEFGELVRYLQESLTVQPQPHVNMMSQLHAVLWGLRALHLYLGIPNTLAYLIRHVFWVVLGEYGDDGSSTSDVRWSYNKIESVFERCLDEGEVGMVHLCLRLPTLAHNDKELDYMRRTVRSASTQSVSILRLQLFLDTQDPDPAWCTALLEYAARKGNVPCLALLLDLARDNPRINPGDAILAAVQGRNPECVRILLAAGDPRMNPDLLCHAVDANQAQIVQLLIGCGDARVNPAKQKNMPLVMAARRGYTAIVGILLRCGDPRVRTEGISLAEALRYNIADYHPFQDQRKESFVRLVQHFLEHGDDPGKRQNELLIESARHGQGDVVRLLLGLGDSRVDPGAQDNQALINAASQGHAAIVKMLLMSGDSRVDPSALERRQAASGSRRVLSASERTKIMFPT
jgi:ankyrin repeat protein